MYVDTSVRDKKVGFSIFLVWEILLILLLVSDKTFKVHKSESQSQYLWLSIFLVRTSKKFGYSEQEKLLVDDASKIGSEEFDFSVK